eukprot:496918-Prorocentrum_minimum.AAC.3
MAGLVLYRVGYRDLYGFLHFYLPVLEVVQPHFVRHAPAEVEREGSRVREEGGGEQAVPDQLLLPRVQHLGLVRPALTLRPQAGNQAARRRQAPVHRIRLLLQWGPIAGGEGVSAPG